MRSANITLDIAEHAVSYPENIALVDRHQNEFSYFELDELIWKTSYWLRVKGVNPGDVVGVYCQREINSILLFLGIARYGATIITLPKSASIAQIIELLRLAKVNHIITDSAFSVNVNIPIHKYSEKNLPLTDSNRKNLLKHQPDTPLLIIFGSGSTGKPKLIPIKHATQRIRNEMSREWLNAGVNDVIASLSHFDFTHTKNRLLESLYAGSTYVSDMSSILIRDLCRKHQITVLHASVFHIQRELKVADFDSGPSLPTLRMLCLSASNINHKLREMIRERLTENLYVRYASNETGTISVAKPPGVFEKPGTVGKALTGVKIEFLTHRGFTADSELSGPIVVNSPGNVDGYLDEIEVTQERFLYKGFIPNDLLRKGLDGELTFLGRTDDLIIFNGINIYPLEIESCLAKNRKVRDVVCVKLSNQYNQDIPAAVVQLKEGYLSSEIELIDYCKNQLGSHRPQRIFIVDKIPRSDRGKVNRKDLHAKINKVLISRAAESPN